MQIKDMLVFTVTEFTISDSVTQLHVFLRTIKVASVLIRITEPTKHTLWSDAFNKYAHELNLVKLKCGVECGLRC